MSKIEANAQPFHQSEFMDEIVNLVKNNITTDVVPWLKEYLYLRKKELSCPSIQISSRRNDAQSKYTRMLTLTTAYIKSQWLIQYADRISQTEYERVVDYHIYRILKEQGAYV